MSKPLGVLAAERLRANGASADETLVGGLSAATTLPAVPSPHSSSEPCVCEHCYQAAMHAVFGAGVSERLMAGTDDPGASDLLWSPPRPQDLWDEADKRCWLAAHADAHTRHRCTLGPNHDGMCRCHCLKWFDHEEQQAADAAAMTMCANCSLYPVASDQDRFCVGCKPLVRAANND